MEERERERIEVQISKWCCHASLSSAFTFQSHVDDSDNWLEHCASLSLSLFLKKNLSVAVSCLNLNVSMLQTMFLRFERCRRALRVLISLHRFWLFLSLKCEWFFLFFINVKPFYSLPWECERIKVGWGVVRFRERPWLVWCTTVSRRHRLSESCFSTT